MLCLIFVAGCGGALPVATIQPHSSSPTPISPQVTAPPSDSKLPYSTSIEKLFESIQTDRLIASLSGMIEMGSRHALSTLRDPTRSIYGARQTLIAEFNGIKNKNPDAGIEVWTQPVPMVLNGFKSTTDNVVAVLPGTDINAGVIVVGAHYDTLNNTEFFDTRMRAPGANDNASGIAIMLEAARILAGEPHRATIMFVAFTAKQGGRVARRSSKNIWKCRSRRLSPAR
jgi:hypothetical protein